MDRKVFLLVTANVVLAALLGTIVGVYMKSGSAPGRDALLERIASLADSMDARCGVAVIFDDGDTLSYTGGHFCIAGSASGRFLLPDDSGRFSVPEASCRVPESDASGVFPVSDASGVFPVPDASVRFPVAASPGECFPMASVFKFHQALAVCDRLMRSGVSLDTEVSVGKADLAENTWSPLRDEYPYGGRFTYGELLAYTLQQSDNNACDFLFRTVCDVSRTDSYIRSLGIDDFAIACDEETMHDDLSACYSNWTTPLAAAALLEKFYSVRDSSEYTGYVWKLMSDCRTGQNRIPGHISGKVSQIAHKTGTGDIDADDRIMAVNDIGVVLLPDGRHYSIAVFVSDAAAGMEECEEFIAKVSEAVYEYAVGR